MFTSLFLPIKNITHQHHTYSLMSNLNIRHNFINHHQITSYITSPRRIYSYSCMFVLVYVGHISACHRQAEICLFFCLSFSFLSFHINSHIPSIRAHIYVFVYVGHISACQRQAEICLFFCLSSFFLSSVIKVIIFSNFPTFTKYLFFFGQSF